MFCWTTSKLCSGRRERGEAERSFLPSYEPDYDSDVYSDSDFEDGHKPESRSTKRTDTALVRVSPCPIFIPVLFVTLVVIGLLAIMIFLDPDRPYDRMFTTLPLPLLGIFATKPSDCVSSSSWPLPGLIDKQRWETPHGYFKGWAPSSVGNDITRKYRQNQPKWLPSQLPDGFARWEWDGFPVDGDNADEQATGCQNPSDSDPYYNPANDPLRITNLEGSLLEPLQKTLEEQSVTIKHIALIMMESMREELFPLQQGSHLHDMIMKTHDEQDRETVNELLSQLTPNAERITGIQGKWTNANGTALKRPTNEWKHDNQEGFGGINIQGALTTSSVSTKSLAAIHCGTWPLPVDMFEEAETSPYQPCIPQILELFNSMKEDYSADDFREQKWWSGFFQASTDDYDRQSKFDHNIGFEHVVNRKRIGKDGRWDPDLAEINYFGYPETALKKYIDDYITEALASNQRMFLSHFTSTTHHPWSTPKSFKSQDYFGDAHGLVENHKDLNNYLNTVRFGDAWLGQLMQLFEDRGIANETLVIFVGDHGQAFKEDSSKVGTYDNPHISNHRVPITFRHPKLPLIQQRVNATSMSILPTLLDLLVNTNSLNEQETAAAADLLHDYEGQTFLRPFKSLSKGRRTWNYSLVNPGGRVLSITSADTSWRLVIPIGKVKTEYIFSDLGRDPEEQDRVSAWSIRSLKSSILENYGEEASKWVDEAEKIGLWWVAERKRLWRYRPS